MEVGGRELQVDLARGNGQVYLWVGDGGRRLDNLQLVIQSELQEKPLQKTIQEDAPVADDARAAAESVGLAVARRTGGPVFYSCNLPPMDAKEAMAAMAAVKQAVYSQLGIQP